MLVENKFIFINLPRCASNSFLLTCIKNQINLKFYDDATTKKLKLLYKEEFYKYANLENIGMYRINRHIPLNMLHYKFGETYPIIAIKRDRYKRFISFYNYILSKLIETNENEVFEKLKFLTVEEIIFYKKDDISSQENLDKLADEFFNKMGINNKFKNLYHREQLKLMFKTFFAPISHFTHYRPDIIWFDIEKLYMLEDWVSEKLDKKFILLKENVSNYKSSFLEINDEFIYYYDSVYNEYDIVKNKKSLI